MNGRISGACCNAAALAQWRTTAGRRFASISLSHKASHSQERKGFAFALKEPEPSVLRSHKSKKKLNTK